MQAAYRFFHDRFMDGMHQRAQNLWTDGYRVTPQEEDETAAPPTKFLVYKESDNENAAEDGYVVDPIADTCTCPFFQGQKAEPLGEDEGTVACKHLRGLNALVAEEVAYWNMKAQVTGDYRREVQYLRIVRGLTETMKRIGK